MSPFCLLRHVETKSEKYFLHRLFQQDLSVFSGLKHAHTNSGSQILIRSKSFPNSKDIFPKKEDGIKGYKSYYTLCSKL